VIFIFFFIFKPLKKGQSIDNASMKKALILFFVLSSGLANAQQDPQYSLNMFNIYSVNPAFSGSYDQFNALLINRAQWIGFDGGAPVTQHFSIESPVYSLHGGMGVSLMNDKVGNEYTRSLSLSYAYQTKLTKKSELGIGLSLGFIDVGFEGSWLAPDGSTGGNDNAIPADGSNDVVGDLGLGFYYRMKEFYLGYSVTHLNQPTAVYGNDDTDFAVKRHHYLTLGWQNEITPEFILLPSVHVKTDQVSTQLDFNINANYGDNIWGGMTYRIDDAIVMIVGYNINKNLKFGYAYDITISDLKSESSGSHEILLRYSFKKKPNGKMPTHYRNIRYN
jgi:type IX secretion system PorP/SprF family membrane protein